MKRSRGTVLVALALLAMVTVVALSHASRATPHVRDQVTNALAERFESRVSLDGFQVSLFPRPEVGGDGLEVRWRGRADAPQIVRVGAFRASAGILGLLGTPVRLRSVQLERLAIHVPPGGMRTAAADTSEPFPRGARFVVDEVVAHAARLEIASKDPDKLPRVFDIADLHIVGVGEQDGAEFRATLTNPTPKGRIDTEGRFGPWQPRAPSTTPVRGAYTFSNADLGTIDGLGGTLSSRGTYRGVLERIEVAGEADVPNFSLDIAGQAVPLTTRFTAVVDGTNGNTLLERVDARVLDSHIHAAGAVVRTKDVKGRHVALDLTIDEARIEDLLRLAVNGWTPPLTGGLRVAAKLHLPAGNADVVRRLRLDGEFLLDRARFTRFNVQQRIEALSRRGRGDEAPVEGVSVVSRLRGRFALRNAELSFATLTFDVPGASVRLAGSYHLDSEALDFRGDLLLDARLRETTTGVKAVLASIAQPLFRRRGGGSKIPIRIGGTRATPEFGLDVKRALLPG